MSSSKELIDTDREFMIKPNNIEYFYEEKEISDRVFNYHTYMNLMFKFTTYFAFSVAIWAVYTA